MSDKPTASAAKTLDEILAEKLAAREAKNAKADEAKKLAQIEELDLEERFETELAGPRGQKFEIIDCTAHGEGFIVVKLGANVTHKRFEAAVNKAKDGVPSDRDFHDFVTANLAYPEKEAFAEIIERRPSIRTRCAMALLDLFGARKAADQGKF